MKIALLGDAHGDLAALAGAAAAAQAAGANAAIQLGDLGFRAPLLGAGQDFPRLALPVHAICGNHEDHAFLAHACRSGLTRRWAERGLIYQPRASTARFDGCTVGFLGGALHIDRRAMVWLVLAITCVSVSLSFGLWKKRQNAVWLMCAPP